MSTGDNIRLVSLPVPPEVPARRERPGIRSGNPLLQEKNIVMMECGHSPGSPRGEEEPRKLPFICLLMHPAFENSSPDFFCKSASIVERQIRC